MKKSIKLWAVLFALVSLCLVFASCDSGSSDSDDPTPPPAPAPVAVTGISLDKAALVLKTETDETLTATVEPAEATDKSVTWNSDKPEIATVDQSGKVTGVAEGTATITVTTTDGAKTATCKVTVADEVYTVSFDLNGKTGTAPDNQTVAKNGKIVKPTDDPTADGYKFKGWYKEPECNNAWVFETDTVSEDTTLYAKWTAREYTITYMDEDVEFPETLHESGYPTKHTYGTATTLKSASGVLGYNFEGWYKTSDCSGTAITSLGATEHTDDITLYAKQTPIANALSGEFSVASDKTVKFSPGNLYWDGSKYQFEAKQCDYRHYNGKTNDKAVINGAVTTTPAGTVGSLFWVKSTETAIKPYDETYGTPSPDNADSDTFFAAKSKKWGTLSKDEWTYLFNTRTVNSGTGEGKSYQRATINSDATSLYGLILYPDNYTAQTEDTSYTKSGWETMEANGCVFLPVAGYRADDYLDDVGNGGYYWSATVRNATRAYCLEFNEWVIPTDNNESRSDGLSVRLVWREN